MGKRTHLSRRQKEGVGDEVRTQDNRGKERRGKVCEEKGGMKREGHMKENSRKGDIIRIKAD